MNYILKDIESRGRLAFNTKCLTSHDAATKYARRTYRVVIEQDCFVSGWNQARWEALRETLEGDDDREL